jgi:hypothetical protein
MVGFNTSWSSYESHDQFDSADHKYSPSCREAPAETPASPPIVTVEPSDRWNWMASVIIAPSHGRSFLPRQTEQFSMPIFADRLERPPKY